MLQIITKYKPSVIGKVKIVKVAKGTAIPIYSTNNVITNEMPEFLTGGPTYDYTHIYGQWGSQVNFAEGGGPYFTAQNTDTVADLTTATISTGNAEIPITYRVRTTQTGQSSFTYNILTLMALMTANNDGVYVGAGLVCQADNKELLLTHVAFPGFLKRSFFDLMIIWDLIFSNS